MDGLGDIELLCLVSFHAKPSCCAGPVRTHVRMHTHTHTDVNSIQFFNELAFLPFSPPSFLFLLPSSSSFFLGKRTGLLKTVYETNGEKYTGEWALDKREGKGTCVSKAGAIFDGDWVAGLRHGYGVKSVIRNGKHPLAAPGGCTQWQAHGGELGCPLRSREYGKRLFSACHQY